MNKIQHISVGDIIKNEETAYEGFGSREKITREYVVIDVYPYHILTRDIKTGVKRSFSYGDLITLGIEHQGADVDRHYPRFKVLESEDKRKEAKAENELN